MSQDTKVPGLKARVIRVVEVRLYQLAVATMARISSPEEHKMGYKICLVQLARLILEAEGLCIGMYKCDYEMLQLRCQHYLQILPKSTIFLESITSMISGYK